jgi:cell division protein FtsB
MNDSLSLIEIADDFTAHFYAGDWVIASKSDFENSAVLKENLTAAIAVHVQLSSNASAKECLTWITMARMQNLIVEGESLLSKNKRLNQENEQLKAENANFKKLNTALAKENKRIHSLFPDNNEGNTEVGDVQSP